MYTTQAKKNTDLSFTIKVKPWMVARGHMTLPRASAFKDKRRMAKATQRANFRKELANG